jgi:hypothetical protein
VAQETQATKRKSRATAKGKPAKAGTSSSQATEADDKRAGAKAERSTKAEPTPAKASSTKKDAKPKADSPPTADVASKKAPGSKKAAGSAKTAGPTKAAPSKTARSAKTAGSAKAAGPADRGAVSKKAPGADKSPAGKKAPTLEAPEEPSREAQNENPLHRKLGIRPGMTGVVIAPPADDDNPLLPLPDGFRILDDVEALMSVENQVDYLHFFARNRGELARVVVGLRDKLAPGGSLWVSWIKQSSSRRNQGLPGDLNENVIRRLALTSGLVDVKVASLDNDWSALKLVHRKH